MIPSKTGERIDDSQRSVLGIIQDPTHFCSGINTVLFSGLMRVAAKERVADLYAGNGIALLLLPVEACAKGIVVVKTRTEIVDMAKCNVAMNGLSERIHVLCGDLRGGIAGINGSLDVVSYNPPYMALGRREHSQAPSRATARQELCCILEEVVKEMARLLKNGGCACFMYGPNRLGELFMACVCRGLISRRMKPTHPFPDREANLVLPEAIKDGGHFLWVEASITVSRASGVHTDEI